MQYAKSIVSFYYLSNMQYAKSIVSFYYLSNMQYAKSIVSFYYLSNMQYAKSIVSFYYLSKMQYAKSIVSFYFKKFYTYLPHNKLIEKISGLVNRSFVDSKAEFINIDSKLKALWSSKNKDKWSFNNNDIVDLFTHLMNSIYVKFRGKIYKQVIDIPMGCDCAPKFDDLFLYSIMSMIIS